MQKIAIRCITDKKKGYGNLTRCITLAESLTKFSIKPIFLIDNCDVAKFELKRRHLSYSVISQECKTDVNTITLTDLLSEQKIKFLILDMREKCEIISKKLSKSSIKIIIIDDAFCKKVYGNIIFNGTIVDKFHKYIYINNKTKKYLGSTYFLANQNFKKFRKKITKKRKPFQILVSFGGSDPTNLTMFVLKQIWKLPNIEILVVLGPFYNNSDKIQQFCKGKNNISILYSPSKIWNIFKNSDVAITKGGLTLYELAIMGIPTICIDGFRHEQDSVSAFEKKGVVMNLGMQNSKKSNSLKDQLTKLLEDYTIRKNMSNNGIKTVDGDGLLKTTLIIKKFIKDEKSEPHHKI